MNSDPVQEHALGPRRPLPAYYYHAHFAEMLDFVDRHYAHVLYEQHIDYIRAFRSLPRPQQCLYVRLVNRKGRVFAVNKLRYPELGPPEPLIDGLRECGWVGRPQLHDFDDLLSFLTKNELYSLLLPRFTGLSRSLKKAELVAFVHAHVDPSLLIGHLDSTRLLVRLRVDETRFLLYLYFGRLKESLSQFTMRDLGIVRTQALDIDYEPRFSGRDEAIEHFYFAVRIEQAQQASERDTARLAAEADHWPAVNFSRSASMRDKLALMLGRKSEETGDTEAALKLYSFGESARCGERLVRLLLAEGKREQARQFLERCLQSPRSDEELLVARDMYARKFNKKRTTPLTDFLRAAETIEIDESKNGSPERAAIEFLEARGVAAYRSENLLWRTLFGLLFWDELFASADSCSYSPFEFLPPSLVGHSFYEEKRERIEELLETLAEPARVKRELLKVSTRNYGTPNGIFRWRRSMNDALFALIDHADPEAIASMLRRLCQTYTETRYGFPDLLTVDSDGIRFVEIKSEGDQLRRNQLLRIEQLRKAGFRADVVRIRWILDPQQTYVVVDVETTGGRSTDHRVTELAAVKLRNGKIVDRFQTLLNPQRTIPPNIVRLTGITPAMVAEAPYFSDMADDFETFMQGAIFVAHNVEFDYRFISREYQRIGRTFRYPKLCTCASMRKLYPGHSSYSLAALCRTFDIPLKQHHRALCDAEAAAELLLLINEKRQTS